MGIVRAFTIDRISRSMRLFLFRWGVGEVALCMCML